jgi:hypothetical protein
MLLPNSRWIILSLPTSPSRLPRSCTERRTGVARVFVQVECVLEWLVYSFKSSAYWSGSCIRSSRVRTVQDRDQWLSLQTHHVVCVCLMNVRITSNEAMWQFQSCGSYCPWTGTWTRPVFERYCMYLHVPSTDPAGLGGAWRGFASQRSNPSLAGIVGRLDYCKSSDRSHANSYSCS